MWDYSLFSSLSLHFCTAVSQSSWTAARICSWINHLINLTHFLWAADEILWYLLDSCMNLLSDVLILVKQKSRLITCAAISLAYLHWQTENSTSDTISRFKNAKSSILICSYLSDHCTLCLVQSCMLTWL
jgi:hypothetical protein